MNPTDLPLAEQTNRTPDGLRAVRWMAGLAYGSTIALLVVGAMVTTYDVGMAVPDAPTTFGRNMLTYPVMEWLESSWGVFLEHGHRLAGAVVGLITLGLALTTWARSSGKLWVLFGCIVLASVIAGGLYRADGLLLFGVILVLGSASMLIRGKTVSMRWCGLLALGLVVAQGGLGALRVWLNDRGVAVGHAIVAQGFLAFLTLVFLWSTQSWNRSPIVSIDRGAKLRRLVLWTLFMVVCQLVLGALLRHLGRGPGMLWLGGHFFFAAAVVAHVGLLAKEVYMHHANQGVLRKPVDLLAILVTIQLMLGFGTFATSSGFGPEAIAMPDVVQVVFATSHVVCGALIISTVVWMATWTLTRFEPNRGGDVRLESMSSPSSSRVLEGV